MSQLKIGIVGLPNVGKSTLFNALLGQKLADASNYPFCTIDPNVGVVAVPDKNLKKLAQISGSGKIIPATIEFVDIAGLVKGAAQGEGLGNKFLAHIRETDAICHVVRNFSNPDIIQAGSQSPQKDFDLVCTELILKDLETLDKILSSKARPEEKTIFSLCQRLKQEMGKGRLAAHISLDDQEKPIFHKLFLLTAKPFLIVINVAENTYKNLASWTQKIGDWETIPISARLEEELSSLTGTDRQEYLKELGIDSSGLSRFIKKAYSTLGLQSFYTANPKEAHAWTISQGSTAWEAAAVVHSDFQRGFIKADCISLPRLLEAGSWATAREKGWIRQEGRDYQMQSNDVIQFKFNV